ncbi:MAG TPA: hypothetical protein VNR38_12895 [Ureibacillus sp.]|nr:hypothetical protein [Ureibacillus sp.]
MLTDIEQVKILFQELRRILEKENENETMYIIHQLNSGLRLIDENINNNHDYNEYKLLFNKLEGIYININQPRVGLADYFIWKEHYEERLIVNKDLDTIKENLTLIFK